MGPTCSTTLDDRPADAANLFGVAEEAGAGTGYEWAVRIGHCGKQQLRIGVARFADDGFRRAPLDHLARKHDDHIFGNMRGGGDIVGDVEHGEITIALDAGQELEDVEADRDVEHRCRLVGNQHVGPNRKRPGDIDALALSAGKRVRKLVCGQTRIEADIAQEPVDRLAQLRPAPGMSVKRERPCEMMVDGEHRVERGKRILKHHLHRAAIGLLGGGTSHGGDIAAAKLHRPRRRGVHACNDAGACRLAAAGFADQRQRPARSQRQRDTAKRLDLTKAARDRIELDGGVRWRGRNGGSDGHDVHSTAPTLLTEAGSCGMAPQSLRV